MITPSDPLPQDVEVTAYRSVIATLQADVTIANLQAKIKLLRAQLLGAQTPSTVTETSYPDTRANEWMISMEQSIATMTSKFSNWMVEARQLVQPQQQLATIQGTKHSQNDYLHALSGQPSKRADTRNTPERGNTHTHSHPPNTSTALFPDTTVILTQPNPKTPPRGFSTSRPEYLYQDNGDGSLYQVGMAGPQDYDSDGHIQGPQPSPNQPHHHHTQRKQAPRLSPLAMDQLASPPAQPTTSTQRAPLPSLPAVGARTDHV